MQRILVVGPCGAGKSTLARRLGALLNLPVIHLDRLSWNPGWVVAADADFRARLLEALRRPRWVIDGNYSGTLDLRLPLADTIIFLDFPRWRCMWQVIKRIAIHSGTVRSDMGEGCPEKLDFEFLEYVWNFHDDNRPRLIRRLAALPRDKRLIVLTRPDDVEGFVKVLTDHGRKSGTSRIDDERGNSLCC